MSQEIDDTRNCSFYPSIAPTGLVRAEASLETESGSIEVIDKIVIPGTTMG